MKNNKIISAIVGSSFFAVPYLGINVALVPSLLIGCAAFASSELIFSGLKPKATLKNDNKPLYIKIENTKKQNKNILDLILQIESEDTKKSLNSIHTTVSKIIRIIETEPKKADGMNNFFDYYLPVLDKIVHRYDEIENQKLISKEGKTFMQKADKMIKDTDIAFKTILSNLYQDDIMDADADMKVYNMMLKADGITSDNQLMKGSDKNEE